MWPAIVAAVVAVIAAIFSYVQMRRAQKNKMTPGELDTTSADEGSSLPVVFGTCDIAPNVTAFYAGTPQAIQK
jgi:hypothetical protein